MPPKRGAKNDKPAAKPAAKAAKKTAKDAADDSDTANSIDLNDVTSFQISAARPDLVDELDAKLLPYLKDTITNFLRYKILKRKRDLDDDTQSGAKRPKKKQVEYDDDWQAQNHLGSGSFGNVGLWVKKNSKGETEDEIAIKEAKYDPDYVWSNISGLSREAVMHNHVNKTGVENFVQLRSFKCFIGGPKMPDMTVPPDSTKWLYYLEYAPHGDLLRLIDRYRAWNQYLPEVFLWHAFDGLAKAILAMADHETDVDGLPEQAGPEQQIFKSKARLIHFDIKPENIFCGRVADLDGDPDKRGGLQTSSYPTLKLADFGVTEFDNGRDENNPSRFLPTGTRYYMPPEQKLYGIQWQNPPNHEAGIEYAQTETGDFKDNDDIMEEICDREASFRLTQAMNVWNIGKTMYDLTSLSRKWDYARLSTRNENEYIANNSNAIGNFNILPFQSSSVANAKTSTRGKRTPPPRQPYSTQLTDLIRDCMKPEVADRITAQALYTRTQAGVASHNGGNPDNLPKVFFEENDINNMSLGTDDFPIYDGGKEAGVEENSDVKTLLGAKFDPDWEDLQLPPKKWKSRVSKWEKEKDKDKLKSPKSAFQVIDGKVWFNTKKRRSKKTIASTTKAQPAAPAAPTTKAARPKKQAAPAKLTTTAAAQDSGEDDSDTPPVRKPTGNKPKAGPAAAADAKGKGANHAAAKAKGQSKTDTKQDKKGKGAVAPKSAKSSAKQDDTDNESSNDESAQLVKKFQAKPAKAQPIPAKPMAKAAKNPAKVSKPAAKSAKPAANANPAPKKQAKSKAPVVWSSDDDDDDDKKSGGDDKKRKLRSGNAAAKAAPKSKADNSKAAGKQKQAQK